MILFFVWQLLHFVQRCSVQGTFYGIWHHMQSDLGMKEFEDAHLYQAFQKLPEGPCLWYMCLYQSKWLSELLV